MLWSNLLYPTIKVVAYENVVSTSYLYVYDAPMMEANARNYPCSKSMGGVSHCKDGKFVCKNGKISQSKKTCTG